MALPPPPVYIPATRPARPTVSPSGRATTWSTSPANPAQAAQTTITVASDPLAVTIGSNEFVYTGPNDLTYIRKFVVLVVDSSGRAKGNVDIVPSVDIDRFYKGITSRGRMTGSRSSRPPPASTRTSTARVNEIPEDINHSGALEPRKSDVAISVLGTGKTDSAGTQRFRSNTPKNVASWARVKVLVAATGVSGTKAVPPGRKCCPSRLLR